MGMPSVNWIAVRSDPRSSSNPLPATNAIIGKVFRGNVSFCAELAAIIKVGCVAKNTLGNKNTERHFSSGGNIE
jgi:hypothetical protein